MFGRRIFEDIDSWSLVAFTHGVRSMKLTKIGLENTGTIRSWLIEDLSVGLNLVLGETGAGKSTLRRGITSLLFGPRAAGGEAESAGSGALGGELEVLLDGQRFGFRRAAKEIAAASDALVPLHTAGTNRSLRRELGELSAEDYGTFFNLSFVDAPAIERRMVRRLLERFGATRGTAAWASEAEYRQWRDEAAQRREQLALDTTHWQRLSARRERLQSELAEMDAQHRTRLVDLEQRRDRARAEVHQLEQERSLLAQRIADLERDLRLSSETAPGPRPLRRRPGLGNSMPDPPLQRLYHRLDRWQAEIRRALTVKRDIQRRRQTLARIRGRLIGQEDGPDHGPTREIRHRLAALQQKLQHWAAVRGESPRGEAESSWALADSGPPGAVPHPNPPGNAKRPVQAGDWQWPVQAGDWQWPVQAGDWQWPVQASDWQWPVDAGDWQWPTDDSWVPLEVEEVLPRQWVFPGEAASVWSSIFSELEALKASISRQAVASRQALLQSEDSDLRRCWTELRGHLRWLARRREVGMRQLQRWDPAGYELLQHGQQRFVQEARKHGYWVARCRFLGDMSPVAVDPTPVADPTGQAERQAVEAEYRRGQSRLGELDRAVADTRIQAESLADQHRRLRDGLPSESLRRELHDLQREIDAREPSLRRLRESVQRDEPRWHLKYDGLIETASRWCRQLTDGRWQRLAIDPQDPQLLAADSAAVERPFLSLSRAEQDLVCLSICLAVAQRMAGLGTPVPLILDDLFANLDAPRIESVMETLWEFVQLGHQVLLLAGERQVPQRWLNRPRSGAEQTLLAVYQLPTATALQQRTQWPLVLKPLVLSPRAPEPDSAPVAAAMRWPLITEQTPLAHLDLIEPEWLLVLSQHRILVIQDLLALRPDDLPSALRRHGLTMGQVDRWQCQAWLLCCIPGLRPYDVQLLVGSGITEPEQLEELSAGDVLRKLEIYLATEEGQRVMHTGTAEEQARLHGWMNGLRDNRHSWGARRGPRGAANRRQRWQEPRRERGGEPAPTVRIQAAVPRPVDAAATPAERLTFYLDLNDPVERAPSIGPRMAERFAEIGISTVRSFLVAKPEDLVQKLKLRRLDLRTLADWQHQARLVCQIPNLRGHDAQLLVACEIDNPESLLKWTAVELLAKVGPFANSKEGQRMLRSSPPPDLAEIKNWLEWAQHHRALQVA
jgi:energy-coupling factor transporter ATP-binding protein EcfA2